MTDCCRDYSICESVTKRVADQTLTVNFDRITAECRDKTDTAPAEQENQS